MGAKVISLLAIGAFYGVAVARRRRRCRHARPHRQGARAVRDSSIWRTLALSLLVLGLWALIGLGAGILIPNQVAALLISIAVAWIVEPVLGLVLALTDWGQSISPYLPSRATAAMLETTGGGFDGQPVEQLSWWAGALVLAAYAAVMAGLGTLADDPSRHRLTASGALTPPVPRRDGLHPRTPLGVTNASSRMGSGQAGAMAATATRG